MTNNTNKTGTRFQTPWNGKCPRCAVEKAYIGFNNCECINHNCPLFSLKQKEAVKAFELALQQLEDSYDQSIDSDAKKSMDEEEWGEYNDYLYSQHLKSGGSSVNIWGTPVNIPNFPPTTAATSGSKDGDDDDDDQSKIDTLPPAWPII